MNGRIFRQLWMESTSQHILFPDSYDFSVNLCQNLHTLTNISNIWRTDKHHRNDSNAANGIIHLLSTYVLFFTLSDRLYTIITVLQESVDISVPISESIEPLGRFISHSIRQCHNQPIYYSNGGRHRMVFLFLTLVNIQLYISFLLIRYI
jgi:hypothetical protein